MKIAAVVVLTAAFAVGAATARATPQTGVSRLTHAQQRAIVAAGEWHRGCPVWMSQLRVVGYRYLGFDGKTLIGLLVVNQLVGFSVEKVFA
jgi:hypothetical protein